MADFRMGHESSSEEETTATKPEAAKSTVKPAVAAKKATDTSSDDSSSEEEAPATVTKPVSVVKPESNVTWLRLYLPLRFFFYWQPMIFGQQG